MDIKKTPLAAAHEKMGAKMVDFAGWWMPVQYEGLRQEHLHCRETLGLFDVSHMGEIWVRGPKSLDTLQWLTTNDVSQLGAGEAQYSLLPNDKGGIVDDIIVYCVKPGEEYLVCVNAANREKDFAWMTKNNQGADITDESDSWGQIAIQGAQSRQLMTQLFGEGICEIDSFQFRSFDFSGENCLVARTGYTGEFGYEIFVAADATEKLWSALFELGGEFGAKPIGLGARDTLRTEMGYSLYGHEIDDETNPYAARLGWVVKLAAKDFIGKAAVEAAKSANELTTTGLFVTEKGIPRQGYKVFSVDDEEIGIVTSGTMSPSTEKGIALVRLNKSFSEPGTSVKVQIRNRMVAAEVKRPPFVTPKGVL